MYGFLADATAARRTFVLRLVEGRWKIIHLHASRVIIPAEVGTPE
jgi:hypothetical protein